MDQKSETENSCPAPRQNVDEHAAPHPSPLTDKNSKKAKKFKPRRKAKKLAPSTKRRNNRPRAEMIKDLQELFFEANSAKDFAWHDVAEFLSYRVSTKGELEVLVRFKGFDKDQDEWVNVKKDVRERSIPLEPSECDRVRPGDIVLCYRDAEDFSLYYDAHVIKVQRNKHDGSTCSCIFDVGYIYDNVRDEDVCASRICYRPPSSIPACWC